ncbi:hypothetical protein POKO110462_13195 [Pontibacter korlensis]
MIAQAMFTEERRIRDVLSRLRTAVLYERERYGPYVRKNPNGIAAEAWKERITVYTETFNLLSDYLTDYTVNQHGVLKHVRQAEAERDLANTTLLYVHQLYNARARLLAATEARQIAYRLVGDEVERLEPEIGRMWNQALQGEMAVHGQIAKEGREAA